MRESADHNILEEVECSGTHPTENDCITGGLQLFYLNVSISGYSCPSVWQNKYLWHDKRKIQDVYYCKISIELLKPKASRNISVGQIKDYLSACLALILSPDPHACKKLRILHRNAHTLLELDAGHFSQTVFTKPEHIFAWKTTAQSLDPFSSLFRLQILIFLRWGKVSAKTHGNCTELILHRTHWLVSGGNASCSLSSQIFNWSSRGKRLFYRKC